MIILILIALVFAVLIGYILGRFGWLGRHCDNCITWTEIDVPRLTPHQDTEYRVLDVHGIKFYFTNEQVNTARTRALAHDTT